MKGLISKQVKNNDKDRGIFVCDYCLNYFGTQELLDQHTEYCSEHDAVKAKLPEPGKNILKFKNIQNRVVCPIKIISDFESTLELVTTKCGKKLRQTKINNKHVPSAFCLYVFSRVDGFTTDPITYVKLRSLYRSWNRSRSKSMIQ